MDAVIVSMVVFVLMVYASVIFIVPTFPHQCVAQMVSSLKMSVTFVNRHVLSNQ